MTSGLTGHCAACDPMREVAPTVVIRMGEHELCRECAEEPLPKHLAEPAEEPGPVNGERGQTTCEDCRRYLPCTFREGVWLCRDCPSDDDGDRLRWGE